jgi:general secretion pathway protein J
VSRPPRQKRHKSAGFTLLEALISTLLIAIILSALATVTAQWLPNWNRGIGVVQRDELATLGIERLLADIAAVSFISASRETRAPLFDGQENSLTFVRTSLGPNAGFGLDIVRFAEAESERGIALVRTRAPFVPLTQSGLRDLKFGEPVVLLRSPFRVSFVYAGLDRVWRERWRDQAFLPNVVKITLRHVDRQKTLDVSTVAVVPAQLPVDCLSTKSLNDCQTLLTRPVASGPDTSAANIPRTDNASRK